MNLKTIKQQASEAMARYFGLSNTKQELPQITFNNYHEYEQFLLTQIEKAHRAGQESVVEDDGRVVPTFEEMEEANKHHLKNCRVHNPDIDTGALWCSFPWNYWLGSSAGYYGKLKKGNG